MQAAYDLVRPHGFLLLQYDWPDGTFIHEDYLEAFPQLPWLQPENFAAAYWNGRTWADVMNNRVHRFTTDRAWMVEMMNTASSAYLHPRQWLQEYIIERSYRFWRKRPLWIEIGVTGTGVSVRIECNSTVSLVGEILAPTILHFGYMPMLAEGARDACTTGGFRYTWNSGKTAMQD